MATFEQEKAMRDSLKAVLNQLKQINPKDLIRQEALGTDLNFGSGLREFKRTIDLFNKLDNTPLEDISFKVLNQLNNLANQTNNTFKNILEFSLIKFPNNAVNMRDQLIAQVRDSYDQLYDSITPVLALSYQQGANLEQFEGRAKSIVSDMEGSLSSLVREKEKAFKDIKETLDKVRTAAQEVGVSQHSIHFKIEADKHEKASKIWLVVTIIAVGITIWVAFQNLSDFNTAKGLSTAESIQLGFAKVIIFSILSYIVVWSGKLYKAHKHNYVVNCHRQNALSSFETFVKATTDEGTKNAVLIQATQSIFVPQHTGYIGNEADVPSSPQILEIIKEGIPRKS